MLEKYLIEHCSPTLASLKTANLINVPVDDSADLIFSIERLNNELSDRGVELILLRRLSDSALIYVCRKSNLRCDLSQKGVSEFLAEYGYNNLDVDYCIDRLKYRLSSASHFPHEIGLFLGYPLGDVIGFIDNAGQNSMCTGCWKVYCNQCDAIKTFAKFNKCKKVYTKLWLQGRSIKKLTVAS